MKNSDSEARRDVEQLPAIFDDCYELVCELGRGTTGAVYEARHIRLNRRVAIKIPDLSPETERPKKAQWFLRECRALAYLTGGQACSIPRLHAVAEYPAGHPYYVRDLVDGCTLEQWVTERPIGLRAGLSVLTRVGQVVQWVHDQGFAHRNLLPTNVLVAQDGSPWLIGFGRVGLLVNSQMLPAGAVGTPAEVDVQGLQELLRWLCGAVRQPVLADLQRALVPGAVPTAKAFAEAVAAYQ